MTLGALAGLGVGGSEPASAEATRQAALRLADREPLLLKGSRFFSGERVRVVVTVDGRRHARRIRASRAGTFTATFAEAHLDRCAGFLATAVGERGSRAALKQPQPLCPPRLGPAP